jgi:hypothetical protein
MTLPADRGMPLPNAPPTPLRARALNSLNVAPEPHCNERRRTFFQREELHCDRPRTGSALKDRSAAVAGQDKASAKRSRFR